MSGSWWFSTCLVLGACACAALAQTLPAAREGLDALTDDALMHELATRGLDSLLDRAFEINKIPRSEQSARRSLSSLARLSDPNARLSSLERRELIRQIVRDIEPALSSVHDPQLLLRYAFALITAGVERDVNTLEYWGENPRTQDRLRPVAEAVVKLLDRSATLARAQADALANRITGPNSALVARFEELDRIATTAEYAKYMSYYPLALALDKSSARRRQLLQDAYDYLRQFDTDENPDRNLVRTRMAKIKLAAGDFASARDIFDQVTEGPAAEANNLAIQYEARYFAAVTELMARNLSTAKQHLSDLLKWQEEHLPRQDQAAREGAEAASAMLEYRMHLLAAEVARDDAARKAANDDAVAVLSGLLSRRPDLRPVIYDQLLPRLDPTQDLSRVDPLLLKAMVARGEEQLRASTGLVDRAAIHRALDAARQIVRRRNEHGIDPQLVDSAALLTGFFLDKLDRRIEAAGAFLDYAENFKNANLKNASLALDNAQAFIGELRAKNRDDAQVTALYERFVPLAIATPFSRTEFAFEWARRLQLHGDYHGATTYYRLVPPTDRRSLDARYFQMVALTQQLEENVDAQAQRAVILQEVQQLADEVMRGASEALARGAPGSSQVSSQLMLARTSLLAADLARRELKDPARALELLSDIEQQLKGLAGADALLADAMFIRVQAYMAQQRYTDATQHLVKLLEQSAGIRGAQTVYNLLQKLNREFDRAQLAGDVEQMQVLASNRARLSGFLVEWASNNPDPNIRRFTYRYKLFDADTHRRAADLDPDPHRRREGLLSAREKFKALETPENIALYRQSVDPSLLDPDAPDPQVEFGLALIDYDLGNWASAAERFSGLILSRRIGNVVNTIEEDGELKYVDNDSYWEAVLKLIRCNLQMGSAIEESRQFLKQQYITWGERVGGRKWKPQYAALRQELIPDFELDDEMSSTTTRP